MIFGTSKIISISLLLTFLIMLQGVTAIPSDDVIISEVSYNDDQLYVELQILEDGVDIAGLEISTLDEDPFILPYVSELGQFDYVGIYPGFGVSDLDASDGSATIYTGSPYPSFDYPGDEVALLDSFIVIDFMRYGGGNGDPVLGDWDPSDLGPEALPGESVQIHGVDFDSSVNWVSAPVSPASPNHYVAQTDDMLVVFTNGVNYPIIIADDV